MAVRFVRSAAAGCLAALAVLAAGGAAAAEPGGVVTVMTSFPASFYEPFRDAFEAAHPGLRLRLLNRKTTAAIARIQDRTDERVDVFWASAPDAFEVLKAADRLAPIAPRPTGAPDTVGNQPLDDPDGTYLGFALSGYGLVWNAGYLERHGLPAPRGWEDLKRPDYFRHIGITAPSRSGTMHLMVETVLQLQGWERGWATWLEIAGNLATVTARSYGVPDGVAKGRFGVGLTIDFLGTSATAATDGIRFAYPTVNVFLPASVAVLRDAPNPAGAGAFVDFLLSPPGQALLLHPGIRRLPVRPDAYAAAPEGYPDPFAESGEDDRFVFDRTLSSSRYELVNLLFDELITFRLKTLNRVWQVIHDGEARLAGRFHPSAADLLRQARDLAQAVPVDAAAAADPALVADLRRSSRGVPVLARQAELERDWRAFSQRNLERALALAERAAARLAAPPVADAPGTAP
ncbi:ABC transporter substrate-binding protein [Azospirillum sp. ST 5-10]|uniref:ABC transporter substrate-binding protein n=1 Tax=unclassified Azospirillum TaxID=2630922 RepID=UPI003F4A5788